MLENTQDDMNSLLTLKKPNTELSEFSFVSAVHVCDGLNFVFYFHDSGPLYGFVLVSTLMFMVLA